MMIEKSTIQFNPIGIIRTPYTENAPYQPVEDDEQEFSIIVDPQFTKGLYELDRFNYLMLFYHIHLLEKEVKMVVEPSWSHGKKVGLFASRSPVRPNPIGLSIVRIKQINDNTIFTSGLDVFDKTPLLDIKPYIKDLDSKEDSNYGWLDDLDDQEHLQLHIKGLPHD
ncbi:MAG: tRNA (N6-threonylcarbamoyladenosine(37)-N6)-methyltransferase TrmO, partial [Thermodesulfobacteriota bacterium]